MTRKPTHPGEILKEDVLPAMGLNASQTAQMLRISRQYMSDILNARRSLTPVLCLKIGKLAGNGPDLWMNLQSRFDLWEAAHNRDNQKILLKIPSFQELQTI